MCIILMAYLEFCCLGPCAGYYGRLEGLFRCDIESERLSVRMAHARTLFRPAHFQSTGISSWCWLRCDYNSLHQTRNRHDKDVVNYKHWWLKFGGRNFSCGIITSGMSVMKEVGLAASKTGFGRVVESGLRMWEDRRTLGRG